MRSASAKSTARSEQSGACTPSSTWTAAASTSASRRRASRTRPGSAGRRWSSSCSSGVDAHCERARAEGAEIVEEPTDVGAAGHRRYGCRDPQGHEWFFAQPARRALEPQPLAIANGDRVHASVREPLSAAVSAPARGLVQTPAPSGCPPAPTARPCRNRRREAPSLRARAALGPPPFPMLRARRRARTAHPVRSRPPRAGRDEPGDAALELGDEDVEGASSRAFASRGHGARRPRALRGTRTERRGRRRCARCRPESRRSPPRRSLWLVAGGARAPPAHVSLLRVKFEHVLVVGAGQMGGGIAQVVAASGRRVSLYDAAPGAIERGARDDAQEPGEARREGRAPIPDEVLARVDAGGRSRPRRPDDRGGRRGRGREGGRLPARGRDAAARGGARLEHVLDPDHARSRPRRGGPTA